MTRTPPKPRLVLSITFFNSEPWVRWQAHILTKEKMCVRLMESRLAQDVEIVRIVKTFELLGADVRVSRYRNGFWTKDKPIRWYKRFAALKEE